MKRHLKKALTSLGIAVAFSGLILLIPVGNDAFACGYEKSGGEAFTPKRQNSNFFQNTSVTKEKAVEIVASHIKRLNPELRVGNVNDNGPLYEAEILSSDDEILQVLGVHKRSGRLVVIN
mgnify:CR=1 FL=1